MGDDHITSDVTVNVDGSARIITITVSLDDIDCNTVAWCKPVQQAGRQELFGVLLTLADICRSRGRLVDELGALRLARRVGGVDSPEFNRLIAQRHADCIFTPTDGAEGYSIVAYGDRPEDFHRLLGKARLTGENPYYAGYPYAGPQDGEGLRGAQTPGTDNLSFHVCKGAERVAAVPLVVKSDGVAQWEPLVTNYGGIPASIHLFGGGNHKKSIRIICQYLQHLMRSYGIQEIAIQEPLSDEMLLYKALSVESIFSAELWERPFVDLHKSEEAIYSGVRDSYKSHINWCSKNLTVEYFIGDQISDEIVSYIYGVVQECHRDVIKERGDNMTPDSFLLPIELCRKNSGEVAIAKTPDGEPCAIAITTDSDGVSYYAVGGQISVGNKNPGNFILYHSIIRAKRRGMRVFHVNCLSPAPVSRVQSSVWVRQKWQISNFLFKRAFSDTLDIVYAYRLLPSDLTVFGRR